MSGVSQIKIKNKVHIHMKSKAHLLSWLTASTLFVFGFIFGHLVGGYRAVIKTQDEAIAQKSAQYNPKTGEFEFVGQYNDTVYITRVDTLVIFVRPGGGRLYKVPLGREDL